MPNDNVALLRAYTSEAGYQVGSIWDDFDEEATAELRWPNSITTYKSMRTDPQVTSVMRAIMLPIMRTQWRVDPGKAKAKVTRMVADDLGLPVAGKQDKPGTRLNHFSWAEHLRHALLSLQYGHAYFEEVFQFDGGLDRLRKLAYRPPLSIEEIKVARDGGLMWIKQKDSAPEPGQRFRREQPLVVNRLVAYVNEREGGNWHGVSLLRPAYAAWWLKVLAMRVQSVGFERNGIGIPLYTASPVPEGLLGDQAEKWKEEEILRGRELAQAMRGGENAGMSIPNGAMVSLLSVMGRLPDIQAGLRWFDEQIARAVLANFLSLGQETGSWALGETFESFFVMSLQTIAKHIADVTTQHVIERWVDINFGPNEPAPYITFDEIGSHQSITAEAIMALVQCGALVMDDPLEAYIRQTYSLPETDMATRREPQAGVQKPPGEQDTQQLSGSGDPQPGNEQTSQEAGPGGQ